jgi:hypothetical protein
MPVSLYEISIPVFIHSLTSLSAILKKGEAYADEKGIAHSKLLDARLVDDMAALPYQIQRCSDTSKGAAVRIAGIDNVAMPDNETTFEQLQARIHKTIEVLKSVDPKSMDDKDESPVILKLGGGEIKFTAKSYLLTFAIPNFYFHVSTAYGILVSPPTLIGDECFLSCREIPDHAANELNRGIWACRLGSATTWAHQIDGAVTQDAHCLEFFGSRG